MKSIQARLSLGLVAVLVVVGVVLAQLTLWLFEPACNVIWKTACATKARTFWWHWCAGFRPAAG